MAVPIAVPSDASLMERRSRGIVDFGRPENGSPDSRASSGPAGDTLSHPAPSGVDSLERRGAGSSAPHVSSGCLADQRQLGAEELLSTMTTQSDDCPPDTDTVRRYRRLRMTWDDMMEAIHCTDAAIKRFGTADLSDHTEQTILKSLWISAAVRYLAPFTKNRGQASPTVPLELLQGLYTPAEQQLHEHMKHLRDKAYAHSDADVRALTIEFQGKGRVEVSGSVYLYGPPQLAQCQTLLEMLVKFRDRVAAEMSRMRHLVNRDVSF